MRTSCRASVEHELQGAVILFNVERLPLWCVVILEVCASAISPILPNLLSNRNGKLFLHLTVLYVSLSSLLVGH